MGTSKSSQSSSGSSSSTVTPTPSKLETEFDPTLQSLWNQAQPMISGITGAGGDLAQALLRGNMLPGAYSGATGLGATPYGINGNAQNAIVNESLRSVPPALQQSGMLDSGASQALYARGAQNVLSNVAQFNTQAQQNAMGMGSGIGTSAMQPSFSAASMLTSLLPGLRTITTNSNYQNQANATYQQPLAQTIGQLSQAFGNATGGGALLGGGMAAMGGGYSAMVPAMLGILAGQQANQKSRAGTISGGG